MFLHRLYKIVLASFVFSMEQAGKQQNPAIDRMVAL